MSNDRSLDVDDVLEAADVEGLLTGDDVQDAFDWEQLGRIVGREVGATLGRRLGGAIERWLVGTSTTAEDADDEEGEDSQAEGAENSQAEGTGDSQTDAAVDENDDEDTAGDEDESTVSPPETVDELDSLSYRDLQQLAKNHDVKANLSKDELREELTNRLDLERDD